VALEVTGPSTEVRRVIDGSTCEAVAQASALVIALTINPEAATSAATDPEALDPGASAADQQTKPEPVPEEPVHKPELQHDEAVEAEVPRDDEAARPLLGVGVGLRATGNFGALPKPTLGPELVFKYERTIRFELAGSYFLPRDGTLDETDAVGAHFRLAAMAARTCYRVLAGSVRLFPCAGVGVHWVHATGFGADISSSEDIWSLTGEASFLAIFAVSSHVGFTLDVGGVLPFVRPKYAIKGLGTVHRGSVIAARAAAGVEIDF
jgi:hypothetical protein